VFDLGDIVFGNADLDEALEQIECVVSALPDGVAPCVIGGDHTVTLPVVRALSARRSEPFWVIQLDHHLDLQLWGDDPDRPGGRESIFNTNVMSHVSDLLGPGQVLQIGLNPFVTVETGAIESARAYLKRVGQQVSVTDPILSDETLLSALSGSGRDIYLTVDVDVLEWQSMSSTGYPAEIGLPLTQLLRIIDVVLADNRLIGCDVVEFAADATDRSPKTLADGGRAVAILLHLLRHLRGSDTA
jgi:arginase family enzyme